MEKDVKLILGYLKSFLSKKKLILVSVGVFLLLGLITVFSSGPIYEAKTTFISQKISDQAGGAGLKNIAALIGVNVGGNQGFKDIPMYLYPKITTSVVYNKELLDSKITDPSSAIDSITVREYILKKRKSTVGSIIRDYTIGLPGKIVNSFRKKQVVNRPVNIGNLEYISSEELKLLAYLENHISLYIDSGDTSLEITASSDNPVVAAQLAQRSKEILQKLIIDYRIAKLKENYDFVNSQYEIKKKEYEAARNALAYYTDRNRFNSTPTSLLRKRELEKESALAYSIYGELESQRISSKITLEEVTPIFTTINPSVIPLKSSNPSSIVTLIKFLILGLFVAVLIFAFKEIRKKIKYLWVDL
jgi:uncharacterized protein involved in exopolysaccharide biosynthesis